MMSRLRTARSLAAAVSLLPALLASTAMAATDVGVATAVNPQAEGTAPGTGVRTIMLGNNIYHNERIKTGGSGLVQVLFVDGSTFTVGANSDLVIDEFVFDPEAGTGKLVASMGKGVARFVGGKLSKNKGGVSVRTPAGTIGIRGGIANLEVKPVGSKFSLVFGKELTFSSADGTVQRIYEAGYTMVVGGQGGQAEIRPTNQDDLGTLQQSLTSRPGQNGGAPRPPTNETVVQSGVTSVNSGLGVVNTLPPPKPQVVVATELADVEDPIDKTPTPDVADEDEEPATPLRPATLYARSGGSWIEVPWPANSVSNPGAQGIIGKSMDSIDGELVLEGSLSGGTMGAYSSADGDSVLTGEIGGQTITVGVPSASGLSYFQSVLTDKGYHIGQISQSGVPSWLTVDAGTDGNIETNGRGVFYRGSGDFIALLYQEAYFPGDTPSFETDLSDAILAFGGTAGSFDVMDQGDLRTYTLTADLQQLLSAGTQNSDGSVTVADTGALFLNPLVAQDLGASFLSGVENTGLLVLESDAGTSSVPTLALAASFSIQGSGSSQQSMVSLFLGSITEEFSSGTLTLDGDRRGGYKSASNDATGNFSGGIESLEGADGAHAFGSNAENFVISGTDAGDTYFDSYTVVPSTISASEQYSASTHVAELSTTTDGSTLTRTTRNFSGYAAGMVQTDSAGTLVITPYASSGSFGNTVTFDAATKSVSASFSLESQTYSGGGSTPEIEVSFGNSSTADESDRASVLIDDDTYAATETADSSGNSIRDDSGSSTDADATSYFISNTLVDGADDAIFANVTTKCTCAFLEWGYWGTSLVTDNPSPAADEITQVYLGTWAAGNIVGPNDLPQAGTASYEGHAVGSVVNNGSQYLAAGDFAMSIDFSSRTGSASVTNFDGRDFSASLSEPNAFADDNLFSGLITDGGTMTGSLNASLVAGPNSNYDGVVGDFTAIDGNWMATGVVVGERVP